LLLLLPLPLLLFLLVILSEAKKPPYLPLQLLLSLLLPFISSRKNKSADGQSHRRFPHPNRYFLPRTTSFA
jgi:hypothetical protein